MIDWISLFGDVSFDSLKMFSSAISGVQIPDRINWVYPIKIYDEKINIPKKKTWSQRQFKNRDHANYYKAEKPETEMQRQRKRYLVDKAAKRNMKMTFNDFIVDAQHRIIEATAMPPVKFHIDKIREIKFDTEGTFTSRFTHSTPNFTTKGEVTNNGTN